MSLFPEATQLADEADVRVAGVSIGKVRELDLDGPGNATVATLEIKPSYAPVSSDARAMLRQKTLLGETYVELTTGSQTAKPLADGGRLSTRRVKATVELDEILDTLDPYTRNGLPHLAAVARPGHPRRPRSGPQRHARQPSRVRIQWRRPARDPRPSAVGAARRRARHRRRLRRADASRGSAACADREQRHGLQRDPARA